MKKIKIFYDYLDENEEFVSAESQLNYFVESKEKEIVDVKHNITCQGEGITETLLLIYK